MARIDIEKESKRFIEDLKSGKEKVETSKNFELDYMRQYARADREYVKYVLEHSNFNKAN